MLRRELERRDRDRWERVRVIIESLAAMLGCGGETKNGSGEGLEWYVKEFGEEEGRRMHRLAEGQDG